MILQSLIVVLLIFGICVISYRTANHEFQILQKDYASNIVWSEILQEQLPVVIRNIPPSWLGNWTARKTQTKQWNVSIQGKSQKTPRVVKFLNWLNYPSDPFVNGKELGKHVRLDLTIQNWKNFRKWSWLPTGLPIPYVISNLPNNSFVGLRKTVADGTAIVSSDGTPLEVWISHEAGIPTSIVEELRGLNPWIQSTNEIPGVENVKFIEMRLRPGNVLILPCHWWFAIRSVPSKTTDLRTSWFWIYEFQNPISYLATVLTRRTFQI